MSEKPRPGYTAPVSTGVGVTPNPATVGISWPMSFPVAPASYERSSLASLKSPKHLSSQGTRYDPVRQSEFLNLVSHSPPKFISAALQTSAAKRKRLNEPRSPIPLDSHICQEFGSPVQYEPQKIVTPTNSLQSGKRNHICDVCGATFTRQHNLKSHFLTHTSSKKEFICSECGSEFRRSHDLKRHQKLHTGEKPFACNTCGRRFARADALGRHTKSSGEGGCVNSRKTSSDPGSVTHNTAYQFHSQSEDEAEAEAAQPEEPQRSRTNSMHNSIGVSNDQTSSNHTSPKDTKYPTSHNLFSQNMDPCSLAGGSRDPRQPTLPPLQTALAFENDRPFMGATNVPDGFLSTPRFGISPTFDSRPQSTHPLSFDRGSAAMDDHSNQMGQFQPNNPGMVPLQRYQQLEAEHREAMERIRSFELTKRPPAGQDSLSSARDEDRPLDRVGSI